MTTSMLHGSRRRTFAIAAFSLGLCAGVSTSAAAAPRPQSGDAPATVPDRESVTEYWAVVTANDVHVRSGPSVDAAYPFLKLDRGSLVKVTEESAGWARVPAIGPSFKESFGYIKADRKVKLSADGRTAEIISTVDVLAPNQMARFAPDTSWKAIGRHEPGRTVVILDTIEGQREKVHKIPLAEESEGWLNLTFLRRATDQELAGIDPRTGRPAAPPPPPPTTTPQPTPPPGAGQGSGAGSAASDGAKATTTVLPAEDGGAAGDGAAPQPAGGTPAAEGAGSAPTATDGTAAPSGTETAPLRERMQQVTMSDLEAAMERLRREDPTTAEVGPLRMRYLEFADRPGASASQRQFALARAEQLSIQEEAQRRLQEVQALLNKASADLEIIRNARESMDARQPYTAVGRLNASTIYDGIRLPLLFRLQDPSGGQTIGYIEPGKGFDLTAMLGQLVGIVGKKGYDEALRLNTIEPTRIDVLGKR